MSRVQLSRGCLIVASMALFGSFSTGAHAQINALTYDGPTRGPVPIPPSERGLQTVIADPWFQVSKEGIDTRGTGVRAQWQSRLL